MNNCCADIEDMCMSARHTVLYIAIGCARNADQQYPPFLKIFPERAHLCFWIDPLLEEPPECVATAAATAATAATVSIREYWSWEPESPTRIVIDRLCRTAESMDHILIVQDYTGHDIRPYYPWYAAPKALERIVFDIHGTAGDCYPPISTTRLYRTPLGLLQPPYMTLQSMPPEEVAKHANIRTIIILDWFWRLWCKQRQGISPSEWWTPEHAIQPLLRSYGFFDSHAGDTFAIDCVLHLAIADLCAVASVPTISLSDPDFVRHLRTTRDTIVSASASPSPSASASTSSQNKEHDT